MQRRASTCFVSIHPSITNVLTSICHSRQAASRATRGTIPKCEMADRAPKPRTLHRSKPDQGRDWRIHDSLRVNTTLVKLQLNRCDLEACDAIMIGKGLLDNTCLRVLDLQSNSIEDEGFEMIAQSLRMPPDSQSAWDQIVDATDEMEDIKLDFKVVEKEYTNYLKKLKAENGILTQLDNDDGFMFRDPSARIRFDKIRKKMNDHLMEMEEAGLRVSEAKEYYEKLKGNCHLMELDCSSNYLFEASGFEMAKTLLWNTTLTTLKLGGNSIGEEGVMAMATALRNHVSLTKLDLSGNIFGAEAGKTLANMLVTNTRLTGGLSPPSSTHGKRLGQTDCVRLCWGLGFRV